VPVALASAIDSSGDPLVLPAHLLIVGCLLPWRAFCSSLLNPDETTAP
jgi:hypothetical protein